MQSDSRCYAKATPFDNALVVVHFDPIGLKICVMQRFCSLFSTVSFVNFVLIFARKS